jgi:hypothetical protein
MVKKKTDYIAALSKLKPEDSEDLKFCRERIKKVIDSSNVSEESITELYNVLTMLHSLHQKFVIYNLTWLKQGYMEEL